MAIRVEKAKNEDGFCCSCLDNKPHKRLYKVEVTTYGSKFKMHLCENCAKVLLDGIHNPEERTEPEVTEEEWPQEDEDGWPEDEEASNDGWGDE